MDPGWDHAGMTMDPGWDHAGMTVDCSSCALCTSCGFFYLHINRRIRGIDSIVTIESIVSAKIFIRASDGPARTECTC